MGKSRLAALLTGDEKRLAELAEARGEFAKAADHSARAGDFSRAITLAAKAGSSSRATYYAYKAALGAGAAIPARANARQAGELLKTKRLWREALVLFELATAYRGAAEVSLQLEEPDRAAHFYEKAGDWARAAACFESQECWDDALRMLRLRSRQLERFVAERRDGEALQEKEKVDLRRAGLLVKLGRHDEAARLAPATAEVPAESLERSGRSLEAFDGYLESQDLEAAYHVALRMKHLPPVERADLLRRCGRAKEAAALLCEAGLHPRAAHLLEGEERWPEAGHVWELYGDLVAAGIAFSRGGDYDEAVRCFEEAGEPDLATEARSRSGRGKARED